MKRNRAEASLSLASILVLAVSACSSGSGTASSATTAAGVAPSLTASAAASAAVPAAAYSPQPWILPSPTSTENAKAIWCSALTQVIARTVPGPETEGALRKKADALVTYRQLWDTAAERGYVTAQEADVNRTYLDGYLELTQLKLARKADNSPEVAAVINGMNTLTADSTSLFDSSAAKVTELCQLHYGSAAPTASAAAGSPAASPSGS